MLKDQNNITQLVQQITFECKYSYILHIQQLAARPKCSESIVRPFLVLVLAVGYLKREKFTIKKRQNGCMDKNRVDSKVSQKQKD